MAGERGKRERESRPSDPGGILGRVERRIPYHRLRFLNQSVLTWPRSIDALSLVRSFVLSCGRRRRRHAAIYYERHTRFCSLNNYGTGRSATHGECYLISLNAILDYWKVQRKNARLKSDKSGLYRYFRWVFSIPAARFSREIGRAAKYGGAVSKR